MQYKILAAPVFFEWVYFINYPSSAYRIPGVFNRETGIGAQYEQATDIEAGT